MPSGYIPRRRWPSLLADFGQKSRVWACRESEAHNRSDVRSRCSIVRPVTRDGRRRRAVHGREALTLVIPRAAWIGATVLSCTMLDAMLTQLFILPTTLLATSRPSRMVITAAVDAQARGWL
jgi:hypothetical protein